MLLEKERIDIVNYGKKMSLEGLTSGTSGNISIRNLEKNLVAISPSGVGYLEMTPEDVVIIDLDGNIIDGDKKPSSEKDLHLIMYNNKDCNAIMHTHSKYCTVFACLRKPLEAVHYIIADAKTNIIPCSEYATYGTKELANLAYEAIGDRSCLLLANHGAMALGKNINSAYNLARTMEEIAWLQYKCLSIGKPHILDKEEIMKVSLKFSGYGQ